MSNSSGNFLSSILDLILSLFGKKQPPVPEPVQPSVPPDSADEPASITTSKVEVRKAGAAVERPEHKISWSVNDAQKAGYEHFMLKEIHEQPKVIRDTLAEYLSQYISSAKKAADLTKGGGLEDMLILASGTGSEAHG